MFARCDRITQRRIAGYVGVFLGATLMLLSAWPGIAGAAPKLDKLGVDGVCTIPGGDAVFAVGNSNSVDVAYTWDIDKTTYSGSGVATPGTSYLFVPTSHDNTRVYVDGKQVLAPKQDADPCAFRVRPVKHWVDAKGNDLSSPDVPKAWKLTLESEVDTLTCTWKKGALSCPGDTLTVPFDGSYTITETATPGFDQDGTGTFGPLGVPQNLTLFFNSDADIVVTVTNSLELEVVAAPTTTEAPTTTTEAPTTTLAQTTSTTEEPPTTTSTTEQESTTSTEEPSTTEAPTTTVEEESITSTSDEPTTTTSTTEASLLTEQDATTVAPTTTSAPTTTLAPTTTIASNTTAEPTTAASDPTSTTSAETSSTPSSSADQSDADRVGAADVRATQLSGDDVDPAAVEPAGDTLPVTGGAPTLLAAFGLVLIVVGLAALTFAWGSAPTGKHARRRWLL